MSVLDIFLLGVCGQILKRCLVAGSLIRWAGSHADFEQLFYGFEHLYLFDNSSFGCVWEDVGEMFGLLARWLAGCLAARRVLAGSPAGWLRVASSRVESVLES